MINKKGIDFVTLSLSHHIMQTMNPRKKSVENERRKWKEDRGFFFLAYQL